MMTKVRRTTMTMKLKNILLLILLLTCMSSANAVEINDVESYAVYNDGTLTFYHDKYRTEKEGITLDLNAGNQTPSWSEFGSATSIVVFDASFADALPHSTYGWFEGYHNLTENQGLQNLGRCQCYH